MKMPGTLPNNPRGARVAAPKRMDLPAIISEYVYRDGRVSRWYRDLPAAQAALDRIERSKRGNYTLIEPLKTGPGIWRVDANAAD